MPVVQEIKILLVYWHTGTIFGNTEYALCVYLERLVLMCMRSSAPLNHVTLRCIVYLVKSENRTSVPVGFSSPLQRAVASLTLVPPLVFCLLQI